jgi:hypothetical protein
MYFSKERVTLYNDRMDKSIAPQEENISQNGNSSTGKCFKVPVLNSI